MPKRLIGVDILRAVSILMVLAAHWPRPADQAVGLADQLLMQVGARGTYGVTLFFAISGFLITRTIMARNIDIHRMSLYDFYSRRVARIWPLLLVCIVIGAIALALGSENSMFKDTKHLPFDGVFWLSLFTFTFNWVRVLYTNVYGIGTWGLHWDVMWSLAVEEQFYIFLPLALILCGNKKRLTTLLTSVIVIGVLFRCWAVQAGVAQVGLMSIARFDALALGVFAALYAPSIPKHFTLAAMGSGILLMTIGCLSYELVLAPFAQAAGAALFMLGAQARDDLFGRIWSGPARIGVLSYEMYLLHPLVLEVLRHYVTPNLGGLGLVFGWLLFIAATALLSEAVHRTFTEPANRWLRGTLRKIATVPVLAPST
jgi:peptidoglycan/LPS O-acetylase OafA/YrhL